jgi:hypothetical protein
MLSQMVKVFFPNCGRRDPGRREYKEISFVVRR